MLQNDKAFTFPSVSQNPQRVKLGFNVLCPAYDFISTLFFGKSLINSQTYFITELTKVKSVLILGGGTGKLLLELMKQDIAESYYYLDISESMIQKSKRKVLRKFPEKARQVIFECGSYQNINSYDSFDLIITPYVLDCFPEKEIREVMFLLNTKLKSNGQWLFVDFNISKNSAVATFISSITIKLLYYFFNIFCKLRVKNLPNFSSYFSELNLDTVYENYFLNGMLVGRVYQKKTY